MNIDVMATGEENLRIDHKGGLLLALEGIDGSGKSTQAKVLSRFFQDHGISHSLSSEPTRGKFGLEIRRTRGQLGVERARALFLADRIEHYTTVLEPALKAGRIVITDRYYYSSMAYQSVRAPRGQRTALMHAIEAENRSVVPAADILLYFDIPPELARVRMQARGALDDFETLENQRLVHEAYAEIIAAHPCHIVLDAAHASDMVSTQLLGKLSERLETEFGLLLPQPPRNHESR